MERDFEKYKKIDISQFRIQSKLDEGSNWTVYKAENKRDSKVVYAIKIYINDSRNDTDDNNKNKYISYVKQELTKSKNASVLSPFSFQGLSLTDFNGHHNITLFLNYKKYIIYLKLKEAFSSYTTFDTSDFKVKLAMGKGAFGTVSKVVSKSDPNETYAAKKVQNNTKNDTALNQYIFDIKREIDTMINGKNPTIIEFKGLSVTDFHGELNVTIFTSLATRGSLSKICYKNKPQPPEYDNTARQIIMVGIAYGMMVLHKNNMIHRDFKPDNVLLDGDLHPLIADFGLSKTINHQGSFANSKYCGTFDYMAPEILTAFFTEDRPKYNRSADVYAFGVSMYEIISKNYAYGNLNSNDLFNKVVKKKKRPVFGTMVKGSFQKLANKCWASEIKDRISFEQIFEMLAFNIEENKSQNTYDKYYLEGVNIDKLFDYIDSIVDNSIDLNKLAMKLKENVDDNKSVLDNNQSLSKDVVKTIQEVIRNKEKLINKIENMISDQSQKKITPGKIDNTNNQQDMGENDSDSIIDLNQNQELPDQQENESPDEKQQKIKIPNEPKKELPDDKQKKNEFINEPKKELPDDKQKKNEFINEPKKELPDDKQKKNEFINEPKKELPDDKQKKKDFINEPKKEFPDSQPNQNNNPDDIQDKKDPNARPQRQKTPLNQANNAKQYSPRGNQNQQRKTPLRQQPKPQRGENAQRQNNQPKQAQQKPKQKNRAQTPNKMMHSLNEQMKMPLNSTMRKINDQKQAESIQSNSTSKQTASSTSSRQSKRAATPDNGLTYMLRKKKEINQLNNRRQKHPKEQPEEQNKQPKERMEQPKEQNKQPKERMEQPKEQKEPKEQLVTDKTNQQQLNKDRLYQNRPVTKFDQQKQIAVNNQKKRSKTPDHLIRKQANNEQPNQPAKSPRVRPRYDNAIDYDSYNLNYQSKNQLNRDIKKQRLERFLDKNRQSPPPNNNAYNRQPRKQDNINRARVMRKGKFHI